jgi:2'-hydroxyisoflavone reductase
MLTRRNFQRAMAALPLGLLAGPASRASPAAPKPLRLLILGGTGYVGPALVRSALQRGHQVTIFNRGISRPHLFSHIERLRGDRAPERGPGLSALHKGSWDLVIDIPAYYPRQVEATAQLLADRVRRYIMVSSIAAYADWSIVGMTENSPVRKPPAAGGHVEAANLSAGGPAYGARKVACEQAVARHFGDRWATVRATGVIGAGIEDDDPNKFFWPARLVQGRPILAPGDGTQRLQSIDVRDLADFILHLAESDQMGVFNAIGPEQPFTTAAYVAAARRVTGGSAEVVWSGKRLGEFPMYNDSPAFSSFDPSRARQAGLVYRRSLEDSIRANWDWFRANYPLNFDFAARGYGLAPDVEAQGLADARSVAQ